MKGRFSRVPCTAALFGDAVRPVGVSLCSSDGSVNTLIPSVSHHTKCSVKIMIKCWNMTGRRSSVHSEQIPLFPAVFLVAPQEPHLPCHCFCHHHHFVICVALQVCVFFLASFSSHWIFRTCLFILSIVECKISQII